MPRGKVRRDLDQDSADPQVAPEVAQTPAEEPASAAVEPPSSADEETTVKPRRRWNFLRREADPREVTPAAEEVADATSTPEAPAPSDDESFVEASPSAETEGDTTEVGAATAEGEPVLVPHQPPGKRLKVAAVAAGGLFVAGAAFLGATGQPVIANRALVDTKLNIARTASNAITTLWSYTPENMDSLAVRSARYLTGDFAFQYRKFIDSIVATNRQAQVTNTTSVLGTAVESVTPTDASAVVYTNSVATSPVSKNIPSLRYLSYRLEMKRDRAEWRITRMTTVTTLDLTPQL